MKRFLFPLLAVTLLGVMPPRTWAAKASSPAPKAASTEPIPATRYYPLAIGNRWSYGFKRKTAFSMVPVTGANQDFNFDTTGTQTVEIVREDSERSGDQGKVFVQKATEKVDPTGNAGSTESATPVSTEPRLVGELYFRVNGRGIWLIADGEPDDKGENIEKVTDRRLPLLWVPPDLKADKRWIINCQVDTTVTARITARAGKPQTLKVNGVTYENCIPIVSMADKMSGRLDLGIAMAPISEGHIVDVTWYAPGIGVVRSHQLANFELEPPNSNFTSATAHFEETQELQPGYRAQ